MLLSGKELKALRNRRKLTVRNVAEYSGMQISNISDIENGKVKVNEKNHKLFVDGINAAFFAKVRANTEKAKVVTTEIESVEVKSENAETDSPSEQSTVKHEKAVKGSGKSGNK